MEDMETLAAALLTLLPPLIGLMLKMLRERDTNKHGDAFIDMLKGGIATIEALAVPFPALGFYVTEAQEIVAEAEQIWESSGFTAEDIRFIQYKYDTVNRQIRADLEKFRKLKE